MRCADLMTARNVGGVYKVVHPALPYASLPLSMSILFSGKAIV